MKHIYALLFIALLFSCKNDKKQTLDEVAAPVEKSDLIFPEETNFKNLRQEIIGVYNAKANSSFDNKQLNFK